MADDNQPDQQHEHVRGTMDITEQKQVFEGFLKFWQWLFIATIAILLFLAAFNS